MKKRWRLFGRNSIIRDMVLVGSRLNRPGDLDV